MPVNGGLPAKANDQFYVQLSNPVGTSIEPGQDKAAATILPAPGLSVGDASVTDSASGTTANFAVTLAAPADGTPVTVNYSTADGTVHAGTDYTPAQGTLTFSPTQTTQTIAVPIAGTSTAAERDLPRQPEQSDRRFAQSRHRGRHDCLPPVASGKFAFGQAVFQAPGGAATRRSPSSARAATTAQAASYTTLGGNATAGVDYAPVSGTLTFSPGQTSQTFTIPILKTVPAGTPQTFNLILRNPTGQRCAWNAHRGHRGPR